MNKRIYRNTYELEEEIAGGGFARVYRGYRVDDPQKTTLAIKIGRVDPDPDYAKSIREEARIISEMNHPNIVKLQQIPRSKNVGIQFARTGEGEHDPHFFVMEFLQGGTLDHYIENVGKLPVDETCAIILEVARGLDHVHRKGYFHNDLKLENIVFRHPITRGEPFTPVLIDFGIATRLRLQYTTGSIYIMSPERLAATRQALPITATDVDLEKVDVWGLGVVLYRLLGGKLPFSGENRRNLTERILQAHVEPLTFLRNDIPSEINSLVVDGCLAREPQNRLGIEELGHHLRRFGHPVVAKTIPTPTKPIWLRWKK